MLRGSPLLKKQFKKKGTMEFKIQDSVRGVTETKQKRNLAQQKTKIDTSLMLLTSANTKRYQVIQQLLKSQNSNYAPKQLRNMPATDSQEFDLKTNTTSNGPGDPIKSVDDREKVGVSSQFTKQNSLNYNADLDA